MSSHVGYSESVALDAFVNTNLVVVAVLLPVLATLATGLRFCAGSWQSIRELRSDDWLVTITLVFCWAHGINTLVAGCVGGINRINRPPQMYADLALRTLWTSLFFLTTSLYTVKVAILSFYWRFFAISIIFRRVCVGMIVTLTMWWASSIILIFCDTKRLEDAWNNATGAEHRFNFFTWYIAWSTLSFVFDVFILMLPIPLVKNLHVNLRKKLTIIGIFWLGGFVCVSSIIRLVYLLRSLPRITDISANQYPYITNAFIWAEVEPNAAVIAACLPTYGPLFREGGLFARFFDTLRSTPSGPSSKNGRASQPTPQLRGNHTSEGYVELDDIVKSAQAGQSIRMDSGTSQGPGKKRKIGDVVIRLPERTRAAI